MLTEMMAFHWSRDNKGRNVQISPERLTATRVSDMEFYTAVITEESLRPGQLFQLRIDQKNGKRYYAMVSIPTR